MNIPKNRTMRDDTLLDIASNNPKNIQDFKRVRGKVKADIATFFDT